MRINQADLDLIDKRLRKIQDSPNYFSIRSEEVQKGLRYLGDLHSFWLEHPNLRKKLLLENNASSEKEIKEKAKKGIKQIKRAWKYLTSEDLKEVNSGVLGYLAPQIIERVGRFVDPEKNHSGFRKGLDHVDSPFPEYTPKSPELVRSYVKVLCNEMKEKYSKHPIEIAAETHMRIAGIQAFKEGNKRTARLLERRILEGYGYPTSVIPYGERTHYLNQLTEALSGFKKGDVEKQKPFFQYIAGKVATALDYIIDDLKID